VEAALRESQQALRLTLEVAHIGHWDINLLTHTATRSLQLDQIFGYEEPLADWGYERFLTHVHPEDRGDVDRLFQAGLTTKTESDIECRIVRRDGALRWIWAHGNVFTNAAGEAMRMLGMVCDITERKRNEAERESLYQQVLKRHEELRILSRQLIHAQEEERRRLARELHDEIGQVLTVVSLSLEQAKKLVDEAGWERLDESRAVVARAIEQVRSMSLNLRPPMLDDIGIESALRWFIDRQVNATGIKIDLVSSLGGNRVTSELETACFRIVQETLTNVARHARARTIRIELARKDSDLLLSIQDDGIGFDVAASRQRATSGGSFGLLGMEERTRLLGGEFEIESASGQGTVTRVRLPLKA
jgi:PAS domain S-box-containing protein